MKLILVILFTLAVGGCQKDSIKQLEAKDKDIDQKIRLLQHELDSLKNVKSKIWDMP